MNKQSHISLCDLVLTQGNFAWVQSQLIHKRNLIAHTYQCSIKRKTICLLTDTNDILCRPTRFEKKNPK